MKWQVGAFLALFSIAVAAENLFSFGSGGGSSLGERVELLERKLDAMSEVMFRLDALEREVKQLRGQVEEMNHALEAMKQRQRALYPGADQAGGGAPAPVAGDNNASLGSDVGSATPSEPASALSSEEESEYQQAFNDLMKRRYTKASKSFRAFLGRYPNGQLSGNAQYWLGEANYVVNNLTIALTEFNKVVHNYPNSSKVPDAMLKIGYIKERRGELSAARKTLNSLVKHYPGSPASQLAKKKLARLSR